MGVLERKRGLSKMEFMNTAHELEKFTIERSTRDIPKAYTFSLRKPLCDSARRINQYVTYANSVFPDRKRQTPEKYLELCARRQSFQESAIIEIQNFLAILRLASEILPIKNTILEAWTGLVLKEEAVVKKWKQSDAERYGASE